MEGMEQSFFELRSAFSRQTTFLWAAVFCAGIAIRNNTRGVTSIVDVFGLQAKSYDCLLGLFHSSAVKLDLLVSCWVRLCFKLFRPVCIEGHMVIFGDGIKVGKEGKKMPAVKLMHQSSQSNSKAEYVMGHYLQALSLAVTTPSGNIAAVPLTSRIHDGLVFSNRSQKTVINRFADIISETSAAVGTPAISVADSYYANKTMVEEVSKFDCHLVSRVAQNAVAYEPAETPKVPRRGRPAKKGKKVKLRDLFDSLEYESEDFRYSCRDLYWCQAKRVIRFVICEHESKGRIILMCTKLDLDPITIIRLYSSRWLIETGFKTAIHEIGSYSYRFWMKEMKPTKRSQTKQYLHKETKKYRDQVERKIRAYHIHLALSCITQGLMIHLAINFKQQVFASFNGWLRTIRENVEPSEIIVSNALAATFTNFLQANPMSFAWINFMKKRMEPKRSRFSTKVA